MKSKLFALLMLASLFLLVAPAISYEPGKDPVILSFDPQKIPKFQGPCCESQTFEVNVVIYNIEINEENLYAWDFYVGWPKAYLELIDHELLFPAGWVEGDDYVVLFDDPESDGPTNQFLHVGVTALKNETGFVGDYLELLHMEFHVIYEPCWHTGCKEADVFIDVEESVFVKWTPACGVELVPEYEGDLEIDINPSFPNMEVTFSSTSPIEDKEAEGFRENDTITAYVWISNATKLYVIHFGLYWDSALINCTMQDIEINDEWFSPPWSLLRMELYHNVEGTWDYLWFEIERPCEKPPVKMTNWIIKITFTVGCVRDEDGVPIYDETDIEFDEEYVKMKVKCPELFSYTAGEAPSGLGIESKACIRLSEATYVWNPIPGDFDQDGHISVKDVGLIAEKYGDGEYAGTRWDVVDPTGIDIYDIVWVAKRFCTSGPWDGDPWND